MAESPDGTVVADPNDPGLTDAYGLVYRLTPNHHMTVNGVMDGSVGYVDKICYSQRQVWVRDGAKRWRGRRKHNDPWSAPVSRSPLVIDLLTEIDQIVVSIAAALGGNVSGVVFPTEKINHIDQNVSALMTMVDLLETRIATIGTNVSTLLAQVPALQDAVAKILAILSTHNPVRLGVNLADVEISLQPTPSKPGP